MVTHSVENVAKMCDRGILLHKGRIIYDGDPKHAVDKYLGSAHLIDEPVLVEVPSVHA
jgi:ABC-type polysaccharide/polyol phosphate transport system ATPase subunit